MRPRALLCALLVSAAPIAPAFAASPGSDHAAAVESFRRGTQLVEAGKLQDAIDAFRDALQREPASVGARLDLADCYEKIGAPASAWREYAIAEAYARRAGDARQTMASSSASSLEARLFVVKLVGSVSPAMELRVDGDLVVEEVVARGSVALAPGRHRAALTEPGMKPIALEIAGGAGERSAIPVAFEAEPASSAPAEGQGSAPAGDAPSSASSSPRRTWGFALGGVGLVGVGLGAVLGAVAIGKKSSLESESHDPSVGSARFYADRSSADAIANVSTACLVAGGVALVAGVALVVSAPSHAPANAAWVRVGPAMGRGGGGLAITGGF